MVSIVQPKYLIPKPLREVSSAVIELRYGPFIMLGIRVAVLSSAFFVAYKTKQPGLTILGTAIISLPATMLVIGGVCVYKGIQMIRTAWITKTFERIGNGFAFVVTGYYILENYNDFKMYSIDGNRQGYPKTGRGILEDHLSSKSGLFWAYVTD